MEEALTKVLSLLDEQLSTTSKILEKIESMNTRLINLEKISLEKNKYYSQVTLDLKEIKKEDLNSKIDDINIKKDDIIKALNYTDYRSVIYMFRLFYKNKTNPEFVYPIKITGKRSYEYYYNNKWNPDIYGHHIMNIICLNIQDLFTKYNHFDGENFDNYILNQTFIIKLSDEKFKKEILKSIIEEVRINN